MQFAGKRWEGYQDFERHQIDKRRFFDKSHETLDVRVMPGADATHAWSLTDWNASYRPEGSSRSRQIRIVIEHDWEFRRDPETGAPSCKATG